MAITRMDLNEFVDSGLLQEINRRILHPIGLALEVICDKDGNVTSFGGVWDCRSEPDGIIFGEQAVQHEEFLRKYKNVETLIETKREAREKSLGYHIQPAEDVDGE